MGSLVPTGRMKTCKKESFLQLADYKFQGACCDHLQVRSSDEDFPYGNCLGSFDLYTDIEDEPVVSYGASCFKHTTDKTYLYRTKYGHWCIGTVLGKFKRGALMRSCERDEEKWAQNCPCTIRKWSRLVGEKWESDKTMTVVIRRMRKIIPM